MILGKNKDLSITIESCLILYPKIKHATQHRVTDSHVENSSIISQSSKGGSPIKYIHKCIYIYIYIHTKDSRLAHSDALAQPSFSLAAYESQGVIDSILHAALSGHAHMGPRVWDTIHTHTLTSPTARTMAHHPLLLPLVRDVESQAKPCCPTLAWISLSMENQTSSSTY